MKINNKKLKVGVDIDDTLVDFVGAYILFHNQIYNCNLKKEDFKSYAFNKPLNETMEETIERINIFYKSNFFRDLLPLPNSVEVINLLKQKEYELYIITSRPDFLKEDTEKFINKHFSDKFSDIFFSYNHYTKRKNYGKSKAEICADLGISLLIDDSLEYAKQSAGCGLEVFLFGNLPWNQNGIEEHKGITRVKDWKEIGAKFLK